MAFSAMRCVVRRVAARTQPTALLKVEEVSLDKSRAFPPIRVESLRVVSLVRLSFSSSLTSSRSLRAARRIPVGVSTGEAPVFGGGLVPSVSPMRGLGGGVFGVFPGLCEADLEVFPGDLLLVVRRLVLEGDSAIAKERAVVVFWLAIFSYDIFTVFAKGNASAPGAGSAFRALTGGGVRIG